MRALLCYRRDLPVLKQPDSVAKMLAAGFDAVLYVAKDYNGMWMTEEERGDLAGMQARWGLRLYGWVCCMTEGYHGQLAAPGVNPQFAAREWSVVDRSGMDTVRRPVACDFGHEQYACPANRDHSEAVVSGMRDLEGWGLFDGFLYDFVRYPLERDYCFCVWCEARAMAEFGYSVRHLTELERFHLKCESVRRFAELIEQECRTWKTFLVWPRGRTLDLKRSQMYSHWRVERLSPMLYPPLGRNWRGVLGRFERTWSGDIAPLLMAPGDPRGGLPEWPQHADVIVTHYGLSEARLPTMRPAVWMAMRRAAYGILTQARYYRAVAASAWRRWRDVRGVPRA